MLHPTVWVGKVEGYMKRSYSKTEGAVSGNSQKEFSGMLQNDKGGGGQKEDERQEYERKLI